MKNKARKAVSKAMRETSVEMLIEFQLCPCGMLG